MSLYYLINTMKCPKCSGEMVEGKLMAVGYLVRWYEKNFGVKQMWFGPAPKLFELNCYKCGKCGFLENYAKESSK